MSETEKGLHGKYHVSRTDGSSKSGGKHDQCEYFVLDLTHDKHAVRALKGYIGSLRKEQEKPELLEDLERLQVEYLFKHFPELELPDFDPSP